MFDTAENQASNFDKSTDCGPDTSGAGLSL